MRGLRRESNATDSCDSPFHPSQKISPWVGLRKINISYWGWDDMSPFTNTTLQWLPGEPNDSGFCAYLERAEVAGLKANPCTAMADGLVCEKPVGKRAYHIANILFRTICSSMFSLVQYVHNECWRKGWFRENSLPLV